ncbi:MAG: helix-turn-helix transcriptional regulator [Chloroflexi bacterium]|nr:helix-turn-helix transcriptional regulator [Chloroflexota bacterium]
MTVYRAKQRTSIAGQALKAYRRSHGITQKQLANELGVEARTLRMYENGERALENISDLQRIAALLAIDPEELGLAAKKCDFYTPEQICEVVERVWSLVPQARLVEAHTTIDALLQNVGSLVPYEDSEFLHACACAHNVAGYVKSIVCKTVEAERVIQHFQEVVRIACIIDDQTLFNLALSHHGDMLRRQGKIQQSITYLENARTRTPLAHTVAQGNNARLLGRAYLSNADFSGFEQQMRSAEDLAGTAGAMTGNTLTLYCLGMVYEEYGRGYGRMGKLEKSLDYLELAEAHLPANNFWDMALKASRAEALIYGGEITEGMQLAVEVAHLAQMCGYQRLLERLYRLQCYLDDRALFMSRASRTLNDVLHGQVEL